MKLRLTDYIVCPECGNNFNLKIVESYKLNFSPKTQNILVQHLETREPERMENDRKALLESYSNGVQSGSLECDECKSVYPIIDGIPILLSETLRRAVGKTGDNNSGTASPEKILTKEKHSLSDSNESFDQIQKANQKNFGYEWKTFSHSYEQWEYVYKKSYVHEDDSFFDKKLGLDAGCGMGRYTMVPAEKGAEMIGVDLSDAVEPAYLKSKNMPNFHVIQGDIFKLPFRKGLFDFAQSIGVIDHTPDPEAALDSIKKHVGPKKKIFLMVYKTFQDDNKFKHYLLILVSMLRLITSKMPPNLLYIFLYLLTPVILLCFYFPSWVLWHIPNGKRFSNMLPYSFQQYANRLFRDIHMNLFDRFGNPVERRYNLQNMEDWMNRSNFDSFQLEKLDHWNVIAINHE